MITLDSVRADLALDERQDFADADYWCAHTGGKVKTKMKTLRCSALPRIMSCTASAKQPDILIDTSSEVAATGTAAHEFYARMVDEGLDEPGDLFALASTHGVDADELRRLAWAGLREWRKIRDRINVWGVEWEGYIGLHNRVELTGHADAIGCLIDDPETGIIIDWKTGYKDANYLPQLKGYALLAMYHDTQPPLRRYRVMTVWTRLGITDTTEFTAAEITEFGQEIADVFDEVETMKFTPSESNCMYCPRSLDCPAKRELLCSASRDMVAMVGGSDSRDVTPAKLGELYQQSRMLKKAIGEYEKTLRGAVADAGGKIEFDGGEIELEESEMTKLVYRPDILSEYLTEEQIEELRPCVSKGALNQAVAANAPKRQIGATRNACFESHESAGAIVASTKKTLTFRKTGG